MTIVRVGSTSQYSNGWVAAFSGKKTSGNKSTKKKATTQKKATAKKIASSKKKKKAIPKKKIPVKKKTPVKTKTPVKKKKTKIQLTENLLLRLAEATEHKGRVLQKYI